MSKDTFPIKVLGGVAAVILLVFAAGLYALMERDSGTKRAQAGQEEGERQAEVQSPPSTLILPRLPEPAHARVPDTGSPVASSGSVRPLTASAVGRQGPPPAVRRPAAEPRSPLASPAASAPAATPAPPTSPAAPAPAAPAPTATPRSEPAAPPTGPARVHPRPVVEPTIPPAPPVLLGRPAVPDSAAPPDTSGAVR